MNEAIDREVHFAHLGLSRPALKETSKVLHEDVLQPPQKLRCCLADADLPQLPQVLF